MHSANEIVKTPRRDDLHLTRISNTSGLSISVLPNSTIFAIEHSKDNRSIMINQILALPIEGGMAGIFIRIGGDAPACIPLVGQKREVNLALLHIILFGLAKSRECVTRSRCRFILRKIIFSGGLSSPIGAY